MSSGGSDVTRLPFPDYGRIVIYEATFWVTVSEPENCRREIFARLLSQLSKHFENALKYFSWFMLDWNKSISRVPASF